MFNKKEIVWIVIVIIISSFIFALHKEQIKIPSNFLIGLVVFAIIIFTTSISKKIASGFFSIKIEYKIWEFSRFGYYEKAKLKKPFPIGLIFPFLLSFLSLGNLECYSFLQYDAEDLPKKRILKRHGQLRKTEMNEGDLAGTSAWGFISLILLSILAGIIHYLIPQTYIFGQISKYSIIYGLWNMIPISTLDGTKLFFGSFPGWLFLSIIFLIALAIVIVFI